jgi:TonB-linked SusC/RagA family outer membrane protein
MFVVFALSVLTVQAQNRTLTGKVTSSEDGNAIPGVNVVVKGTTIGAITDADGNFTISAPSDATTLVFTFIGLQTKEVEIGNRTAIDIGMESDVKQLSEVIVTGYTTEKDYAGAATIIKGEIMQRAPVASVDQLLQGRVPGVLVNSGSGQPGSNATVRIRGVSSITGAGAQPLYVVDGVPIAGDLSGINPNDIESTNVLKDAAAGALYGARGATGVIVITTKKGKPGQNAIDFRTQYGYSMKPQPMNFKMMNTEETLAYEEKVGNFLYQTTGATSSITGPGWAYSPLNPTYATSTAAEQANRDQLLAGFRANKRDFSDDLYRDGRTVSNEIVARGGTNDGTYYVSLNAFNQEGFAMGSNFDRYTGRLNIDQRLMDKLSFNLSSTVIRTVANFNAYDGINSAATPFQIVWRAKPYEQVYKPDGTLDFGASTALAPKTIANAIERQKAIIYRENGLRLLGGLGLQYDIIKGLSARNKFSADIYVNTSLYEVKANTYSGSLTGVVGTGTSGRHNEAMFGRQQIVNTSSLNYTNVFSNKHEVDAGVYFEILRVNNNGFGYTLYNLDKRLQETGQGASNLPVTSGQTTYPQNAQGAKSQYGIRSYFATAKYAYDNKYSISLSAREDGTSRILNDANKEIFTWSAALNWNAINEAFLSTQDIISDLRVRATYGEVPNIGSIATSTYGIAATGLGYNLYNVPNYLGPQLPSFGTSTAFAGSTIPGLIPTSPGNPDLKIETVKKTNVGFDLGLFNRATLTVDLYQNVTVDMFVSQRLSATTGFGATNLNINAGQMTNKGIELSLTGDIYKKGDFSVTANWNHAINVNNIDDLGQVDEYVSGTFIIKKGMPYGSHYTYNYIGADPATGMPAYKNKDGSTVVTNTLAGVDQMATFGTFLPKHTGGFSVMASWKGISLSTLFSYQTDVSRYNNVYNWITAGYPGYINAVNQSAELLTDQWMQPGDQKRWASPAATRQFTSADVMDAKFLRWRELTISYTLPKIKYFKEIRVYARGQNLKIWSPWKGWDPEDNNNISLNEYPNPKMYVFGLDFTL